ncbi:phage holin family protein [Tunicatimonas pelagia]|uniref:phage holin family protein n=1 Tax=Tunicatimonas pelagia TaxID=931531 RepID=UPI0026670B22|nr:phage holin family protein [Tunicatimonas pelagia]WKN43645.1 phage holin family protein [Tunicatimonas pelagia]
MSYPTSPLEKLLQDAKDYVVVQRRLISTIASKKGADIAFVIVAGLVFFLIGLFIVIFISFTVAYGLAILLNNTFLGFLIVTFFYILVFILLWIFKDRLIKTPILKLFFQLFNTKKPSSNEPIA